MKVEVGVLGSQSRPDTVIVHKPSLSVVAKQHQFELVSGKHGASVTSTETR